MHGSISGLLLLHWVRLTVASDRARDDRGDVPGWVMVTVMSAAVVAALIPLVRGEMGSIFKSAMSTVTSAK